MNLKMLQHDVEFLKKRYEEDVPGKNEGRLVIRCVCFPLIHRFREFIENADLRKLRKRTRPRSSRTSTQKKERTSSTLVSSPSVTRSKEASPPHEIERAQSV